MFSPPPHLHHSCEVRHGLFHGEVSRAAYLCFLGIRMILDARKDEAVSPADQHAEEIPSGKVS